ncbi:MAG: Abi family protein [Puniceicoccales bacterium]|jgi:abortive infection bacteriophage resistance protein|nr:Abi family protein [Puniceicoccales bacterium]
MTKIPYDKPFLTIAAQRELLEQRGLRVEDRDEAEHYLRHQGYYRLSAYFHPFLERDAAGNLRDAFRAGADFGEVARLYEFDKQLRTLMLAGLRAIEISVRVAIAHHLGQRDIFAHENPRLLAHAFTHRESTWRGKTWYQVWLEKYRALLARGDQEDFVRRFLDKYGARIPIWVAIELWDFGLLSRFYAGMRYNDQRAVSLLYGVEDPGLFASWLRSFNYVRNVCAHHSRLWNRNIVEQPRLAQRNPIPALRHLTARGVSAPGARPYAVIAVATHTLLAMQYRFPWRETVARLFESFPTSPHVSLTMTGAPANWRDLTLWERRLSSRLGGGAA